MNKLNKKKIITTAALIYLFALAIVFVWWKFFSPDGIPLNEVGDFLGGGLGPAFTFLTIYLLIQDGEEESSHRNLDKEIRIFNFYLDTFENRLQKFKYENVIFSDAKNENITTLYHGEEAIIMFIKHINFHDGTRVNSLEKINELLTIFNKICIYVKQCDHGEHLEILIRDKVTWFISLENEFQTTLNQSTKKNQDITIFHNSFSDKISTFKKMYP